MAKIPDKQLSRMKQGYIERGGTVAAVFFLVALTAMPLSLGAGGYATIYAVKLRMLALSVCTLGFGLLGSWLVGVVNGVKLRYRPLPFAQSVSAPEWALAAYLAVSVLSAACSVSPRASWLGLPTREDGVLQLAAYAFIFFALARAYRPKLWHSVFPAAGLVGVCAVALAQSLGWQGLVMWEDPRSLTFVSTLGNQNIASTYLCMLVVLFFALFVRTGSPWRWAFLALSGLGLYTQFYANSSAGYVGIATGIALSAPWLVEDNKQAASCGIALAFYLALSALSVFMAARGELFLEGPMNIPHALPLAGGALLASAAVWLWGRRVSANVWRIAITALLAACAIGGLAYVLTSTAETGTVAEFRELLHGNITDEMGSYRGFAWKHGLTLFAERPVLGSGPDTFGTRMVEATGSESISRFGVVFDKAHNEYIEKLVNTGALGLLSYLAFLALTFFQALKKKKPHVLLCGAGAAGAAYAAQALFTFASTYTTPIFWIFLGVAAGASTPERHTGRSSA